MTNTRKQITTYGRPNLLENRGMKSKAVFVFALIVILVLSINISQGQDDAVDKLEEFGWDVQSSQVNVDLRSIFEVDTNLVYAVGESGVIIKTTDGGNWTLDFQDLANNFREIEGSGNTMYVVGDFGMVYKKTESQSWTQVPVSTTANFNSVSVVNETTVFVAGQNGEIWKTADGGQTWNPQSTPTSDEIFSIDMFDENNGLASGENGMLIGTSDGQTWIQRDLPEGITDTIRSIVFFSVTRAFAVGDNGLLLKSSSEGGSSVGFVWSMIDATTNSNFQSIFLRSAFKFWIVGDQNTIILSNDGGKNFFNQTTPISPSTNIFYDISARNGINGYIVGENGILLSTDREGVSARDLPKVKDFSKLSVFVDFATPILNEGFKGMIKAVIFSLFIGFFIGVIVALMKTAGNVHLSLPLPALKSDAKDLESAGRIGISWFRFRFGLILVFLGTIYTDIFRNTPLVVQLFLIHFGLPQIGIKIVFLDLQREFISGIIGLSLNTGAYQAEIIRAGIEAIPRGQMEAGRSLGLTYTQTMRYVILPQALRIAIPPLGNELVNLILNSSLLFTIGYFELTRSGQLIIATTFLNLQTWVLVMLYYFVGTYTITNILRYLEGRTKIPGLGAE